MTRTHIGIDATALPAQPVGAGNYIIYLIQSLAEVRSGFDLTVFIQRSRRSLVDLDQGAGVRIIEVADLPPALRLAWEQTFFPSLVYRTGLDLLHSPHYTMPLALSCNSVVTFHDMTFFLFPHLHTRAKRLLFPLVIRSSARRATALIADSESTRQDTIRLVKVMPEKIFTVPLGVSEYFRQIIDERPLAEIRARYKLPESFILYVGLIEPRKNLPMLLRSYKSILLRGETPPLVIAGRFGWGYEQVISLVGKLGLEENIRFIGHVPHRDLPMVYNLAGFFVYPSTYEGFGLPPLEAMACGTPVISTAISSIPEHVGEAGLLVPPGDEEALAEAMLALLNDRSLREELANLGPARAALFSWKRTAQETLKVYQHVLDAD